MKNIGILDEIAYFPENGRLPCNSEMSQNKFFLHSANDYSPVAKITNISLVAFISSTLAYSNVLYKKGHLLRRSASGLEPCIYWCNHNQEDTHRKK